MTAAAPAVTAARQLSAEALAVMKRFPPRPVPASWDATAADRFAVMRRMLAPPFPPGEATRRDFRKLGMLRVLGWLELHPGTTWQERWDASGAGADGRADWRDQVLAGLGAAGRPGPRGGTVREALGGGLVQLIGGDVLRPGLSWLLATASPRGVATEMGRTRDPAGVAALRELRESGSVARRTSGSAIERVALIMAAKGGMAGDITPGDCMQLLECSMRVFSDGTHMHSPFFYELLHSAGVFPPGAPARPVAGASPEGDRAPRGSAGDRATRTRPPGQAPRGREPGRPGGRGPASPGADQDHPGRQDRTQETRRPARPPAATRHQDRQAPQDYGGQPGDPGRPGPPASQDHILLVQ